MLLEVNEVTKRFVSPIAVDAHDRPDLGNAAVLGAVDRCRGAHATGGRQDLWDGDSDVRQGTDLDRNAAVGSIDITDTGDVVRRSKECSGRKVDRSKMTTTVRRRRGRDPTP